MWRLGYHHQHDRLIERTADCAVRFDRDAADETGFGRWEQALRDGALFKVHGSLERPSSCLAGRTSCADRFCQSGHRGPIENFPMRKRAPHLRPFSRAIVQPGPGQNYGRTRAADTCPPFSHHVRTGDS